MRIVVNGSDRDVRREISVAELVDQQARSRSGTAVAINGDVVPRSEWATTRLTERDEVEILSAVGGG